MEETIKYHQEPTLTKDQQKTMSIIKTKYWTHLATDKQHLIANHDEF